MFHPHLWVAQVLLTEALACDDDVSTTYHGTKAWGDRKDLWLDVILELVGRVSNVVAIKSHTDLVPKVLLGLIEGWTVAHQSVAV